MRLDRRETANRGLIRKPVSVFRENQMLKNRISAYRNERQNRKTENRNAPLRYGRFTTTSISKYEHFTHKINKTYSHSVCPL